MMRKKKRKYPLRRETSPEMNKILSNHAEWLDYNVSKVAGNRCRKDALKYAQHKDPRQTGGRRKHDRSNEMGHRFGSNQE
jgi:hypothetical protein